MRLPSNKIRSYILVARLVVARIRETVQPGFQLSILFVFAIAFLTTSCVELESQLPTTARPVVQGYLIPGHNAEVNVRLETVFLDTDTTIDVEGLDLTLKEGSNSFKMISQGKGRYIADVIIQQDHTYDLSFPYNGSDVTASTPIPPKPVGFTQSDSVMSVPTFSQALSEEFPEPIELKWSNPDQKYYLVIVETIDPNATLINKNQNRPPFSFRNDPTQGNTYQLRPQLFQYYGKHRVILLEVTADYAALYQQNGTSSISIKTPFTNVTNGLGIFTGVNTDTLYVRAKMIN